MRILIVEDEQHLSDQLKQAFQKEGYAVDVACNGEDGLFNALNIDYDLAVVDIGLPKIDGLTLIAKLRQSNDLPVLLLTARDHWQDKVTGLNAGADDYLAKPFQMEELQARVKALIRRRANQSNPVLAFGDLRIDTNAAEVSVAEQVVNLTSYEYQLLTYLVRHPNKVISKMELTEHLYAQDFDRDSNVIEVFVKRLRAKISPQQPNQYIHTIRGQGYKFKIDDLSQN